LPAVLFPRAEEVIFTAPPHIPRHLRRATRRNRWPPQRCFSPSFPTPKKALDYALTKAASEDAVFITGSLYLIGQLRHY